MNSNYEIISKDEEKRIITVKHIKCGCVFTTTIGTFENLIEKSPKREICPNCDKHFETLFMGRLGTDYEITGIDYIPNKSFVNQQIELRHLSKACNYFTRKVTPHTLSNTMQTWCPVCRKFERGSDFNSKVKALTGDEYSVIGEYKGSKTKIRIKHNICGHEWSVRPDNFIGNSQKEGSRCPHCQRLKVSK